MIRSVRCSHAPATGASTSRFSMAASACAVLAAIAALAACGGSGNDSTPPGGPGDIASPKACAAESLAQLQLDGATILQAMPVAAGSYTPPGTQTPLANLPAFCRVQALARPSDDSLIHFEVWLPQEDVWNGKLVATGNGGYSPALSYGDMAYALRQGYATLGGDTGHQTDDPADMMWGVGHPEKIRDWGTRSIHAVTQPGKQIVAELAGQSPSRSYYLGCSTGGHQAYAQVQQYPEDFDGVIAGAPGNNRTSLNAEFLWRFLANRESRENPAPILTREIAAFITQEAVQACDHLDGVEDGVIDDPRLCTAPHFDVAALQCLGNDGEPGTEGVQCLSAAQVAAAQKIYQGPRNPRTGEQIYPGQVVGSESGWPGYWGGAEPVRADYWRYWAFNDPQWDWWSFEFDRDLAVARDRLAPLVDHNSADIEPFRASGAKLLVYHGWNDPVVVATDSIDYYERVKAAQGSQAAVDSFMRLFMVPGMGHCGGGVGATNLRSADTANVDPERDLLAALDRWVEEGRAPDHLLASGQVNGEIRTRPVCAYPQRAVYRGSGSTDSAENFECQ